MNTEKIQGILIGTAVGDSIGLPMEGMKPKRIQRLKWAENSATLRHHFLLGKGMWSDDTEHSIMLTQALLASGGDLKKFQRSFAWELRWWLLALPAGVGLATARAIIKLWLGFPVKHSGVFSAGNGSAMRTAMIAAYFPTDQAKRHQFTIAQTKITHSDPKASIGALAVTELVAYNLNHTTPPSQNEVTDLITCVTEAHLKEIRGLDEARKLWISIIHLMQQGWDNDLSLPDFLSSLQQHLGAKPNRGVSGYVYQSVPIAIYAVTAENWDFRKVINSIVSLGGDTDTVAAIAGAICGSHVGIKGIPNDWKNDIIEWPCTIQSLEKLSTSVHNKKKARIRPRFSISLLTRNIIFLIIVLLHGLARLIPR